MRVLPWFHHDLSEKRESLKHLSDCDACKKTVPRDVRRAIGCGLERPAPNPAPWQPPIARLGYQHGRLSTCAGFLARQPEVVEIARAHTHWEKGSLQAFCGKEDPSDLLLLGIEILAGEMAQVKAYALTSKTDGGGRD